MTTPPQTPYVSGDPQLTGRFEVLPPPPKKRARWPWFAGGAVALVGLTIAGTLALAGNEPTPVVAAAVATTQAAAAAPARDEVMCTNIQRAYNAWDGGGNAPKSAGDVLELSKPEMGWAMDDGEKLGDATTGYDEQGSKALAVAVAEYNVQLGFANVALVIGGEVDQEAATKAADAAQGVRSAFGTWWGATCV